MVKTLLGPTIKRFIGLFISMVLVVSIGFGVAIGLNGSVDSIGDSWTDYKAKYNQPDAYITSGITIGSDIKDELLTLEGVEDVVSRISLDSSGHIPATNKNFCAQLVSHRDADFNGLWIRESGESSLTMPNVMAEYRFASNGNIHVGDTIKIGFFEQYINCNVKAIVSAPETITYSAMNSVSGDTIDFGRLYLDASNVIGLVSAMELKLDAFLHTVTDPEIAAMISEAISQLLSIIGYGDNVANQFLLKAKEGYTGNDIFEKAKETVEKYATVIEHYPESKLSSEQYISTNLDTVKKIAIAIPGFFFIIAIVIVAMFLNQIIKSMMKDIGTMAALGISRERIFLLLAAFSLVMSVCGALLGAGLGHGLLAILNNIFSSTYSMPPFVLAFKWKFTLLGAIAIVIAGQVSTFLSTFTLFKVTPKEAISELAGKKKNLSEKFDKAISKLPTSMKISVNSVASNPRRFLVSIFSIIAASLCILLCLAFNDSMNFAISQTFDHRLNYTSQVFFQKRDEAFEEEVMDVQGVKGFELSYYVQTEISKGDYTFHGVIEGLEPGSTSIKIPKSLSTYLDVPAEGIALTQQAADELGVKEGDTVTICGHDVVVAFVSEQCLLRVSYMTNANILSVADRYICSYFVETADNEALLSYVTNNYFTAYMMNTHNLKADFDRRFSSTRIVIMFTIGFAFALGFMIVSIMMQSSLNEQKHNLCVMRSLGFGIGSISNLWSLQTGLQFVISTIIALPLGALLTKLLLSIVSNNNFMLPFAISPLMYVLTTVFVLTFILLAHAYCMYKIGGWNIAENTKERG